MLTDDKTGSFCHILSEYLNILWHVSSMLMKSVNINESKNFPLFNGNISLFTKWLIMTEVPRTYPIDTHLLTYTLKYQINVLACGIIKQITVDMHCKVTTTNKILTLCYLIYWFIIYPLC